MNEINKNQYMTKIQRCVIQTLPSGVFNSR